MAAGGALPFVAGAVGALLLLRLILAVINFVARRRRSHIRTLVVLGSGTCKLAVWRAGTVHYRLVRQCRNTMARLGSSCVPLPQLAPPVQSTCSGSHPLSFQKLS